MRSTTVHFVIMMFLSILFISLLHPGQTFRNGYISDQSSPESLCSQTPPTLEMDYLARCSERRVDNCALAWRTFAQGFEKKDPHAVDMR